MFCFSWQNFHLFRHGLQRLDHHLIEVRIRFYRNDKEQLIWPNTHCFSDFLASHTPWLRCGSCAQADDDEPLKTYKRAWNSLKRPVEHKLLFVYSSISKSSQHVPSSRCLCDARHPLPCRHHPGSQCLRRQPGPGAMCQRCLGGYCLCALSCLAWVILTTPTSRPTPLSLICWAG